MYGFIQINSQPTASTIIPNTDTEFEIDASLNDSSTSGMGYQWQMNGSDISNGSFSTQNITVTPGTPTSEEIINYSFNATATGSAANNTFTVPAGAENVRVSIAGGCGGNGAAEGGNAGGVGGHGMSAWFDVIGDNSTGQALYETPGIHYWTCPANVTTICVVCVGGGGGDTHTHGAGGQGQNSWFYYNNIAGQHWVGAQGGYGSNGGALFGIKNPTGSSGGDGGGSSSYGSGGGGAGGWTSSGHGAAGSGGGEGVTFAQFWAANGAPGSGCGAGGGSTLVQPGGDSEMLSLIHI